MRVRDLEESRFLYVGGFVVGIHKACFMFGRQPVSSVAKQIKACDRGLPVAHGVKVVTRLLSLQVCACIFTDTQISLNL
jgi:hypothetical protein